MRQKNKISCFKTFLVSDDIHDASALRASYCMFSKILKFENRISPKSHRKILEEKLDVKALY